MGTKFGYKFGLESRDVFGLKLSAYFLREPILTVFANLKPLSLYWQYFNTPQLVNNIQYHRSSYGYGGHCNILRWLTIDDPEEKEAPTFEVLCGVP